MKRVRVMAGDIRSCHFPQRQTAFPEGVMMYTLLGHKHPLPTVKHVNFAVSEITG